MRIKIDVAALDSREIGLLQAHGCSITREAYQIDTVSLEGNRKAIKGEARMTQFFAIDLDDGTQLLEIHIQSLQLSMLIVDVDLKTWDASPPDSGGEGGE